MIKIHKTSYLPILFIAVFCILIYFAGTKIPEETIRSTVKNAEPFGVIVLILLFWLTNIIAPLSGSPILYVGFYLYGQTVVVYAFIAAILASISNFWIAKICGRPLVVKFIGSDGLNKVDGLTKEYGLVTLFIFRLFLKEFHDVISYAFGLTKLKFTSYFLVSILGMIPTTIIWYYISLKIHNAMMFTVASWLFAYLSLGFFIFLKIIKRKGYFLFKRKNP